MKKIICTHLLITTLLCLWSFGIIAQNLEEQASQYVWNLSSLYSNNQEWQTEVNYIEKKLESIPDLKGKAFLNPSNMLEVLNKVSDLRSRAAKLVIYGALLENLDITSSDAKNKYDAALKLEDQVESTVGFMKYDVNKVPHSTLEQWYQTTPELKVHKKRINRVKNESKYLLSEETESSLRSLKRLWNQSGDTFQSIMESDLNWPTITLSNGEKMTLDLRGFYSIRKSNNKEDIALGVRSFLEFLKQYEEVFKIQLINRVDKDLQLAQLRGFATGPDANFFLRDGFPSGTAKTFRDAAKQNKATLQRFVKIIGRIIGTSQHSYADLYIRINHVPKSFTIEESIDIVFDATKFLGPVYQNKLRQVLSDSILHLGPSKNKRNMWAIYPPIADAKAYTIMKYNESFLASNIFMRAMIGNLAQYHYRADTRDDPPVYNNSIIYTGSLLHYDFLINKSKTKEDKLFYLVEAGKRLWNSFFKYAIYASFENEIEKRLASNSPLDVSEISNIYYQELKRFLGNDIDIPEVYKYEWMTISQPFSSYEHQYWPIAIAASCNILERIQSDEIITALLLGKTNVESDRSHQILEYADIKMNETDAYDYLILHMNNILDQIEKSLANDD